MTKKNYEKKNSKILDNILFQKKPAKKQIKKKTSKNNLKNFILKNKSSSGLKKYIKNHIKRTSLNFSNKYSLKNFCDFNIQKKKKQRKC